MCVGGGEGEGESKIHFDLRIVPCVKRGEGEGERKSNKYLVQGGTSP